MKKTLKENYGGLKVFWKKHLAGGGRAYRKEYLALFKNLPKAGRVFEWCSGPAFIGFSLLAYGHCEELCLADINPECVNLCKRTVEFNKLEGRVSVYLSDCLGSVPREEKWDVVVGNPPHFYGEGKAPPPTKKQPFQGKPYIVSTDYEWSVHRSYYRGLSDHLLPGGISLVCENSSGSEPQTFTSMVEEAGLSVVHVGPTGRAPFYFFGVMHSQEEWENSRWKHGLL